MIMQGVVTFKFDGPLTMNVLLKWFVVLDLTALLDRISSSFFSPYMNKAMIEVFGGRQSLYIYQ